MSRPLRVEFPGAIWHVTSRGNERREIYRDDKDRRRFIRFLAHVVSEHRWLLHAWVLMPNHYHLLLGARIESIARLMKRINGSTANRWNKEDGTSGRQVWYRYSDRGIRGEDHWYAVLAYIHENPVKHGYVALPTDWNASSVHWYSENWGPDSLEHIERAYPREAMGRGWDDFGS